MWYFSYRTCLGFITLLQQMEMHVRVEHAVGSPQAKNRGEHIHNHSHAHVHEERATVEQNAVEREGPPSPGQHVVDIHLRMYTN